MDATTLKQLLEAVSSSELSVAEAFSQLQTLPFADSQDGRIDHHRAIRRGFPEVIFGQYKTPEQAANIFHTLSQQHDTVLCTRITEAHAHAIAQLVPESTYVPEANLVFAAPSSIPNRGRGTVLVICAGTADLPVAREALWTSRLMGNHTELLSDVGVAGLHRILAELPIIRDAEVVIVVAGMEGALPSVVGGLSDRPLIAVPTSVGYGASQGGWAALLGMLSSCAAGITVVNIDNGFGAAYAASLANRKREQPSTPPPSIQLDT
jgi:NCAIR mutase (PurE)-related protein